MKYLVIDTESTGAQRPSKGSALDPRNHCCYVGLLSDTECSTYPIEYEVGAPFGSALASIALSMDNCDLLVFFNAKHDLHWLRRYNLPIAGKPIWDCQLAEFILNGQTTPFPNLHDTSRKYGAPGKQKSVEEIYYNEGKDTDEVPREILVDYLIGDLSCTETTFLGQLAALHEQPLLKRLIWENCQDETITEEMEWNGLHFDIPALLAQAQKLETHILEIDKALYTYARDTRINWDAPAQVSAILYGGTISFKAQETYEFVYRNPKRLPIQKTRQVTQSVVFPRLVQPLSGSELASGNFSTEDKVLRKLKATAAAKEVVNLILDRRTTQTQITRYFRGIPNKYAEMGWTDEIVHGQLHHVVASTGRLSSSNPNMQNIDERARSCLKTRFKT